MARWRGSNAVSAPRPGGRSSVVSSAARSNAAVIPSDRQVAVRLLGAPVHLCMRSLGRLQPLLESARAPALELQLSSPGIPLVRGAGELRLQGPDAVALPLHVLTPLVHPRPSVPRTSVPVIVLPRPVQAVLGDAVDEGPAGQGEGGRRPGAVGGLPVRGVPIFRPAAAIEVGVRLHIAPEGGVLGFPGGPRRPATCSPPPGKPSTPPSGAMWRRTPTSIAAAGRKIGTPRAGRPPTDPGRRPPSPWPAGPSSTASPRTACTGRSRTKTGTDVRGTDGRGWTSGVSTCSGRATASGPWGRNSQASLTSDARRRELELERRRTRALEERLQATQTAYAEVHRRAEEADGHLPLRRDHGGGRSRRGRDHTAPAAGPWRAHRVRTPPPGHCADAGGTGPRRRPAWPARRSRPCQKRPQAISYLTWTSGRFWIAGRSNDSVAGLAEPVRPLADGPARGTPDPGLGRGQPQRAGRWGRCRRVAVRRDVFTP